MNSTIKPRFVQIQHRMHWRACTHVHYWAKTQATGVDREHPELQSHSDSCKHITYSRAKVQPIFCASIDVFGGYTALITLHNTAQCINILIHNKNSALSYSKCTRTFIKNTCIYTESTSFGACDWFLQWLMFINHSSNANARSFLSFGTTSSTKTSPVSIYMLIVITESAEIECCSLVSSRWVFLDRICWGSHRSNRVQIRCIIRLSL